MGAKFLGEYSLVYVSVCIESEVFAYAHECMWAFLHVLYMVWTRRTLTSLADSNSVWRGVS